MTINTRKIFLAFVIGSVMAVSAFAQEQEDQGTRRIWDSEFLKKRAGAKPPSTGNAQTSSPASSTSSGKQKFSGYRRASAKTTNSASKVENKTASTIAKEEATEGELLGFTIWRLRASIEKDNSEGRILLEEESTGKAAEWTPERVEADTVFTAGQRLRLSIESPQRLSLRD